MSSCRSSKQLTILNRIGSWRIGVSTVELTSPFYSNHSFKFVLHSLRMAPQSFTMSLIFLLFTTELRKLKHLSRMSWWLSNHVTWFCSMKYRLKFLGRTFFPFFNLHIKVGTRTKLFVLRFVPFPFFFFLLPVVAMMLESTPMFLTTRTKSTH